MPAGQDLSEFLRGCALCVWRQLNWPRSESTQLGQNAAKESATMSVWPVWFWTWQDSRISRGLHEQAVTFVQDSLHCLRSRTT